MSFDEPSMSVALVAQWAFQQILLEATPGFSVNFTMTLWIFFFCIDAPKSSRLLLLILAHPSGIPMTFTRADLDIQIAVC